MKKDFLNNSTLKRNSILNWFNFSIMFLVLTFVTTIIAIAGGTNSANNVVKLSFGNNFKKAIKKITLIKEEDTSIEITIENMSSTDIDSNQKYNATFEFNEGYSIDSDAGTLDNAFELSTNTITNTSNSIDINISEDTILELKNYFIDVTLSPDDNAVAEKSYKNFTDAIQKLTFKEKTSESSENYIDKYTIIENNEVKKESFKVRANTNCKFSYQLKESISDVTLSLGGKLNKTESESETFNIIEPTNLIAEKITCNLIFYAGDKIPQGVELKEFFSEIRVGNDNDTDAESMTKIDDFSNVKCEYGKTLYLALKANEKYDISQITISGAENIEEKDGFKIFKISEVKEEKTLTINNIQKIIKIKFLNTDNVENYSKLSDRAIVSGEGGDEIPFVEENYQDSFSVYESESESKSYEITPKIGYTFKNINRENIEISSNEITVEKENEKFIITLANIGGLTNENEYIVKVPNIAYKMYDIKIYDDNGENYFPLGIDNKYQKGTIILEQSADTTEEIPESCSYENPTDETPREIIRYGAKLKIKLTLSPFYTSSEDGIKINGFNLVNVDEKNIIYTFEKESAVDSDLSLVVKGINKKYLDFKLETNILNDKEENFENNLKIKYKTFNENQEQTGDEETIEFDGKIAEKTKLIPYGKNFEFQIISQSQKYYLGNIVNKGKTINTGAVESIDFNSSGNEILNIKLNNVAKNIGEIINEEDSTLKIDCFIKKADSAKITFNGQAPGKQYAKYIEIKNGNVSLNNESTFKNYDINYDEENKIKIKIINTDETKIQDDLSIKLKGNISWNNEKEEISFVREDDEAGYYVFNLKDFVFKSDKDLSIDISGISVKQNEVTFEGDDFSKFKIERKNVDGQFENLEKNINFVSVDYGDDLVLRLSAENSEEFLTLFDNIEERLILSDNENKTKLSIEVDEKSKTAILTLSEVIENETLKLNSSFSSVVINLIPMDGIAFYKVTKEDSEQYQLGQKISGGQVLNIAKHENENFSFAIIAEYGYTMKDLEININKEEYKNKIRDISERANIDGAKVYLFEKIEENINLEIKGVHFIQHYIDIETSSEVEQVDGQKINIPDAFNFEFEKAEDTKIYAEHNQHSNKFKITMKENCTKSDFKVNLYDKDGNFKETLLPVNEYYRVLNVTEDNLKIKVENIRINKYILNFQKDDSFYFTDETSKKTKEISGSQYIEYGKSFSFSMKPREGYQFNKEIIILLTKEDDGKSQSIEPDSFGNYTISQIQNNYNISLKYSPEQIIYRLNFMPIDGVTYYSDEGAAISGNVNIHHGKNFEFSISISDAYSDSLPNSYITTNNNGQKAIKIQRLSNNKYMIQNVTQDIDLKVANVVKNKYTITLKKDEGIEYYDASGNMITGDNDVEYGENLSFKVKIYPAYEGSNIRVMLKNQEMTIDDSTGLYTIENVLEGKTVTVVGIEKSQVNKLIDAINSLPNTITDDTDLEKILEAARNYNQLTESQKASVTNYSTLEKLKDSVANLNHTYNGITAEGLEWNIKLIANPITADIDACGRIYEKLGSEYIISLYDIYLWDTMTQCRYTLPDSSSIVVYLPTPDFSYFENPSGIHECENGKLDFLNLNINGSTTSLQTSSLSPIGIVAKRSLQPGRSSLIDSLDANVSMLSDYTLNTLSGGKNKNSSPYSGTNNLNNLNSDEKGENSSSGEEIQVKNKSVTQYGSALRLVLIIMIILIIFTIIFAVWKKYKSKTKKED